MVNVEDPTCANQVLQRCAGIPPALPYDGWGWLSAAAESTSARPLLHRPCVIRIGWAFLSLRRQAARTDPTGAEWGNKSMRQNNGVPRLMDEAPCKKADMHQLRFLY